MSLLDRWLPWRLRAQAAEYEQHALRHAAEASRWRRELETERKVHREELTVTESRIDDIVKRGQGMDAVRLKRDEYAVSCRFSAEMFSCLGYSNPDTREYVLDSIVRNITCALRAAHFVEAPRDTEWRRGLERMESPFEPRPRGYFP